MAHAIHRSFLLRAAAAVLAGGLLGGFLGLASAQERAGWLNPDCVNRCTTKGYDAEFCGNVCWVPDPAKLPEEDDFDWKCVQACGERGGDSRACFASCRR